jgi:DNA-binding Xre family transcriptional regulator
MTKSIARAYVAVHEGFDTLGANGEKNLTYSGYVEGETPSENLASPEFSTLAEVIDWALERTDFVVARDIGTTYFWAGVGDPPVDLPLRDEIPKIEVAPTERLDREPKSREPKDWLLRARADRKWSVNQLAAASGVSDETVSKLELGEQGSDDRLDTWVKLVCALEGRRRIRGAPKAYAVFRGDWIKYAFAITESSSKNETDGV